MRTMLRIAAVLTCLLAMHVVLAQDVVTKTFPAYGNALLSRISPEGQYLATFEEAIVLSNEVFTDLLPIRIYDVSTGQEAAVLDGEPDYAVDVAFSPDSRQLAALYPTGWVHIWTIPDGETVKRLPVAPGGVRLRWMADGETLAIASVLPPQIQLWDIESGAMTSLLTRRFSTLMEQRETQSGPADGMAAFTAASDGSLFAYATYYGNVVTWTPDGAMTLLYDNESDRPGFPFREILLTPDHQTIVALDSLDETLFLMDVETGDVRETDLDVDIVSALAVSPDGTRAVWLSSRDSTLSLQVADLASGEVSTRSFASDMMWRLTPVLRLHFTSDNQLVMTGQFVSDADPADYVITQITLPE